MTVLTAGYLTIVTARLDAGMLGPSAIDTASIRGGVPHDGRQRLFSSEITLAQCRVCVGASRHVGHVNPPWLLADVVRRKPFEMTVL